MLALVMMLVIALAAAACAAPSGGTPVLSALPPTADKAETRRQIDAYLSQLNQAGGFSGAVLVARAGEIRLRMGYGLADRAKKIPNTPQTRFRIASITKQFTAMAILMLQEQGKLNVQDAFCDYFPDCPAAWKAITIHQLLTHTSGIPNFTELPGYDPFDPTPYPPPQIIARVRDQPLSFKPGEQWHYSNSGYVILGEIIARTSSQSYENYLQQAIFTPLGMYNSGLAHCLVEAGMAEGYATAKGLQPAVWCASNAEGGMYSTVGDLYLWDQALYTERLISRDLLEQMFARQAGPAFDRLDYGYGWFVGEKFGRAIARHDGRDEGVGTLIIRYPQERATIIVLGNQRDSDIVGIAARLSGWILGEE